MSISHLHSGSIDRIPPHNLEAEMALIGSMLVDREIMGTVGEIVQPSDFYAHVHETIFAVLLDLFDRGEPLDKITVAEALRQRDALEKVGGLSYLSSLMDTVQTAASATYYAKIVREKAVLRSLIHAGTQITQLGYEARRRRRRARSIKASRSSTQSANARCHGDFVAGQPPDERSVRPHRPPVPSTRRPHRSYDAAFVTSTR